MNRDKITHISNGVNLAEFDRYAQENAGKAEEILRPYKNKYIVAYTGAMSRANQMDTIIGAARKLLQPVQTEFASSSLVRALKSSA